LEAAFEKLEEHKSDDDEDDAGLYDATGTRKVSVYVGGSTSGPGCACRIGSHLGPVTDVFGEDINSGIMTRAISLRVSRAGAGVPAKEADVSAHFFGGRNWEQVATTHLAGVSAC
jgi:hypothetical protein